MRGAFYGSIQGQKQDILPLSSALGENRGNTGAVAGALETGRNAFSGRRTLRRCLWYSGQVKAKARRNKF